MDRKDRRRHAMHPHDHDGQVRRAVYRASSSRGRQSGRRGRPAAGVETAGAAALPSAAGPPCGATARSRRFRSCSAARAIAFSLAAASQNIASGHLSPQCGSRQRRVRRMADVDRVDLRITRSCSERPQDPDRKHEDEGQLDRSARAKPVRQLLPGICYSRARCAERLEVAALPRRNF